MSNPSERAHDFPFSRCTPVLNPQKGIWSLAERAVSNAAAADLGQITWAVKRRLKQIQYLSRR